MSDAARAWLDMLRGRFRDPQIELQYRRAEFERTLWLYRLAVFASAMIHASYLLIDHFVLGEQAQSMWLLRLTVLIPASLLLWAASYRPWFERRALVLTIGLFIVNGAAMAFGTALFGADTTMYFAPGTVMVIIYAYILLSIHYWIVTVLSLTLVATHLLVLIGLDVPSGSFANAFEAMLVSTFILMIGGHRVAMTSRTAFLASDLLARHEGARAERSRIMRDLHDDVAARLLTLSHRVQEPQLQGQAREALGALRQVIYALDEHSPQQAGDLLNDLQARLRERARAHSIEVRWQEPETLPGALFGSRYQINLQRILSEAASNAIRHCTPTHFTVSLWFEDRQLHLHLCNDGVILRVEDWIAGKGVNNIRSRVEELGGAARWTTTAPEGESGGAVCCLELSIPLPAETGT